MKNKMKNLGELLINDFTLKQHIKEKQASTQAILQTCIYTSKYDKYKLRQIKIRKLLKLYDSSSSINAWLRILKKSQRT